ncbi:hypothetical protein [Pseudomonas sp. PONIH3]|jgi:hypothetical protein|uniref:hypothetical protein n=1 Tax=Pseudomonas sp. PONIH3 TaxID=1636610 RepID=UPI000CDBFEB5|nr:hypothetical protein [Pseudomonas sp. PONIH3]AUY32661.1 hypothetical protein C3F42_05235 [Pseudomonas sp. PONIH3]
MSEELASIKDQALRSVLAAVKDLGVNLGEVYDRACALNEEEGGKVLTIDQRRTGDVAMAISLAMHEVTIAK